MKAPCKKFKTVNASDEFKSTFKVWLKWALPDRTRRDPKFVERPWRHDSRACLSLPLLCFVFVSDGDKLKSGFKRSYRENMFRICFQPVWEKDKRIRYLTW